MLPIYFVYIAAAMRLFGGLAYFFAVLRNKAKPDPVSWLLWGVVPLITFVASLSADVGQVAIVTLALGVSPLLVFGASIFKHPKSLRLRGFNLVCAIIALAGIALWLLTSRPELAIGAMIVADFASSLPTVKKSILNPTTEFAPTYLISASSMILTLLTISDWKFAAVAYPIYVLFMNSLIFSLVTTKIEIKF